jgi:hypothetical protein
MLHGTGEYPSTAWNATYDQHYCLTCPVSTFSPDT